MSLTVIVPFHRNLADLTVSLTAVRRSVPDAELIVAADGATEDYAALCRNVGARVVVVDGPSGPAVARNRAAAVATGDVLVFVDADVQVTPEALSGIAAYLDATPEIAGVFGAYDDDPRATNFMSQFKNLAHTYVHEIGRRQAQTFWAGLGAVRAEAFGRVGGFDERFAKPSIEDIDLGYRLVDAGYRIELDPRFRGKHLKRWTFRSCVRTDIQARGIPWTQVLRRRGALPNDLNTSTALRLSVVASGILALAAAASVVWPWALAVAAAALAAVVALNLPFYSWFARKRGLGFALRVIPIHVIHHLSNGVSFATGTLIYHATRAGLHVPGGLPLTTWTGRAS